MKNTLIHTILFCTVALAAGISAQAATIDINFGQTLFSVMPGQTNVAAIATLTNTDPVNEVFLNADNISVPAGAVINDEFFTNVPLALGPGQSSGPIELFRFDVAPNATAGTLIGTYQLLGGVGTANQFNFDLVGQQTFSIAVQAVPEPAGEVLAGALLLGISLLGRKRFRSIGKPKLL